MLMSDTMIKYIFLSRFVSSQISLEDSVGFDVSLGLVFFHPFNQIRILNSFQMKIAETAPDIYYKPSLQRYRFPIWDMFSFTKNGSQVHTMSQHLDILYDRILAPWFTPESKRPNVFKLVSFVLDCIAPLTRTLTEWFNYYAVARITVSSVPGSFFPPPSPSL